jgi:histone H3/H4
MDFLFSLLALALALCPLCGAVAGIMREKSTPVRRSPTRYDKNITELVREDMTTAIDRVNRPITAAAFHGMAKEILKDVEIKRGVKGLAMTLKASHYLQLHFNMYMKRILEKAQDAARVDGAKEVTVEDVKQAISRGRFD